MSAIQCSRCFYSLCLDALSANCAVDFDLFIESTPGRPFVLYREQNLPITDEDLGRLRDAKVPMVYVLQSQRAPLVQYLEKNLSRILGNVNVPLEHKSSLLYLCAQEVMREILERPGVHTTLSRSEALVDLALDLLLSDDRAFGTLLRMTSYDYYTYTHSVNVMVYGLGLSRRAGIGTEEFLARFGQALLLHDIGKSRISLEILNKQGKLTPEEWEIMKQHPVHGRDILLELGLRDELVLEVVLHHHEKLNGSGYPDGLRDESIQPAVRISTLVDIFDALTTRRPYKEAQSTFAALRRMREESLRELDPTLFRNLIELMGTR